MLERWVLTVRGGIPIALPIALLDFRSPTVWAISVSRSVTGPASSPPLRIGGRAPT